MAGMTARGIIRREYGYARNPMTPDTLSAWRLTGRLDGAAELAQGRGMSGQRIFGVSVVELLPGGSTKRRTDLAHLFQTEEEARAYIWRLGGSKRVLEGGR